MKVLVEYQFFSEGKMDEENIMDLNVTYQNIINESNHKNESIKEGDEETNNKETPKNISPLQSKKEKLISNDSHIPKSFFNNQEIKLFESIYLKDNQTNAEYISVENDEIQTKEEIFNHGKKITYPKRRILYGK